jgi:hypothetical protein
MKLVTATMIATHVFVTELSSKIENVVHNLFTVNFFPSTESYDD